MTADQLFPAARIDLDADMCRIGYSGSRDATLGTLQALHNLHPQEIAFENLDPLFGNLPVRLDPESLVDKLVRKRRGGYCFEQNLLFGTVLSALGFGVTGLSARIRWSQNDCVLTPRGHMLLKVQAEGEEHIADVGFGALTLTAALRLDTDREQQTPHERFRLVERNGLYRLDAEIGTDWRPVYVFDLQAQVLGDYEIANYYLSSHPSSHFCDTLIAARPFDGGRYALLDNRLTIHTFDAPPQRTLLTSVAELRDILGSRFLIDVPRNHEAALSWVIR
ncbi:arylamine N-acetyltransferase [Chelativorans sp. M5D2P16]|uniref:arylamine N-acetyltransferase family protein n=1 Tax=Chelativorans sp. M5D2P16 TaxID=3095678 RepID=UPI002ACA48A0|nr:arylamine N-acetyltransferase [Chelativorans sp. M5D2P16]MDZ5698745.1 arylamine N-acetyltransferase [Chelativorans sp. M5D2P16]